MSKIRIWEDSQEVRIREDTINYFLESDWIEADSGDKRISRLYLVAKDYLHREIYRKPIMSTATYIPDKWDFIDLVLLVELRFETLPFVGARNYHIPVRVRLSNSLMGLNQPITITSYDSVLPFDSITLGIDINFAFSKGDEPILNDNLFIYLKRVGAQGFQKDFEITEYTYELGVLDYVVQV